MIHLFYGTQLYGSYIAFKEMHADISREVYNGGYIYMDFAQEWYRCDVTPVLLEDVPKQLRMLVLVLNL